MKFKKIAAIIFFTLISIGVQAKSNDSVKEYIVGTDVFNHFEFPSSVEEAVLPPDAPLVGTTRYVNGTKGLLIRFEKDASEAFQMVVTLKGGKTHMLKLIPEEDGGAQSYRIGDFTTINRRSLSNQRNPNADYLKVISEKLDDLTDVPRGFSVSDVRLEKSLYRGETEDGEPVGIALSPVERLKGTIEGRKVFMDLFHLESTDGVGSRNLDPSQFSEKGVGAVTITRDAKGNPFVLMIRQAN